MKTLKPDQSEQEKLSVNIPSPCPSSLHRRLAHVGRVLAHRQQEALARHGLDLRSYTTLMGLEHAPCATQLMLAKESRVDKSTLVAILDDLEKAGWVERTPDARDRRARIVCATAAGKAKLAAAHACVSATEKALLGALDASLRQAFVEALGLLAELA